MRDDGRRVLLATVTALAVLGAASCGVGAEQHATPLRSVAGAPTAGASATAVVPSTRAFVVWMESDGDLVRVLRRLPSAPTPATVLGVVEAGPTQREQRRGLRTALVVPESGPLLVAGAAPAGGAPLRVTVDDRFQELPANEQLLAVGQVVLSMDSAGFPAVEFVARDGSPLAVPVPGGKVTDRPVTAADYSKLRARP